MNRILFYLFYCFAVISKLLSQKIYNKWIVKAIGADAVMKGDIPDYSVVVGNPCRIISDTRQYGEKIIKKQNGQ